MNEVEVSYPEAAGQRAVESVPVETGPSLSLPCMRKTGSFLSLGSCISIAVSVFAGVGEKGKNISLYVHKTHK